MKKESFELENHSFQCGEIEIFRFSFQNTQKKNESDDLNIRNLLMYDTTWLNSL